MALEIINRRLNIAEFKQYIKDYYFGSQPANKLVIHHTWKPTLETWDGARTIQGLKRYYEGKGWPAGPHLFIANNDIWLFTPMRQNGIHAGRLNDRSIGIEVVGNYDQKVWSGPTKQTALGVIRLLQQRLAILNKGIFFHRDASSKSCPGNAITKPWLMAELANFNLQGIGRPANEPIDPQEVMIPVWAAEAVAFVRQHGLFEIRSAQDVRDAVKFHRFYQLIENK